MSKAKTTTKKRKTKKGKISEKTTNCKKKRQIKMPLLKNHEKNANEKKAFFRKLPKQKGKS